MYIPKLGPQATEVDLNKRRELRNHKTAAYDIRNSTSKRLDHGEEARKTYEEGMRLFSVTAPIASTLRERAEIIADNRVVAGNMRERAKLQLQDAERLDRNSESQESI